MKKSFLLLFFIFLFLSVLSAQTYNGNAYRRKVAPTKNIILMIPDGTSIGVVSAARWYQIYNKLGGDNLAIDPYMCGTVKTFSSNSPIVDSAPATSAFTTGMPQQSGNVAIYPPADPENDLVEVDASMAYQPLTTIMEAMRIEQNKALGLVVTVEFPHATPADCSAHHYDRNKKDILVSQVVHQNIDVVLGGGVKLINDDLKQYLENKNISYYANDIAGFRRHKDGKLWSLWCDLDMPFHIDRDTTKIPSLSEMTSKALDILSKDENGFFLMVEGSKIDWLAHSNDPIGCITEYLEFDKAVGLAMDFAIKDGNTTVVVLPDHGNSGFTIGRYGLENYDKTGIGKLFANVSKYKRTGEGLAKILKDKKNEDFKPIIKEYTDIDITDEELNGLLQVTRQRAEDYMKASEEDNLVARLVEIMNKNTYFGFTSGGHTGEEVFLAAYHPQGDVPMGMNTNIEINHYLSDVAGLNKRLPELTKEIFAKHTEVFGGLDYTIDRVNPEFPTLIVKRGERTLRIPAFKSVAYLDGKIFDLGSVVVYIDKTDTFYLPANLKDKLK